MIKVYYSLIYPYVIYCNLAWGGTYPNHLLPLIKLQKKIIRLINNEQYLAHLFYKSKILKIEDVATYVSIGRIYVQAWIE